MELRRHLISGSYALRKCTKFSDLEGTIPYQWLTLIGLVYIHQPETVELDVFKSRCLNEATTLEYHHPV